MAFCGFSHHTAYQRAEDYTIFLLVIITIGFVWSVLTTRVSRFSTSVVVRTQWCILQTLTGPFKASSRCHISYTSTIKIGSSLILPTHSEVSLIGDCLTIRFKQLFYYIINYNIAPISIPNTYYTSKV